MPMTDIQLRMASVRYSLAAEHARGLDLLEVGSGAGFGLNLISHNARSVVGGDVTHSNLRASREHYPGCSVARFDAHRLPFAESSFDVVAMFEVIYYLADIPGVLAEVRRVLRPRGEMLVCLPNRERPGFHRSPQSYTYPSAGELHEVLVAAGFDCDILAGFRMGELGIIDRVLVAGAVVGRRFHVIPSTLRARSRIKRLVHGEMRTLQDLRKVDPLEELVPVDWTAPVRDFKNLYAVGRLAEGTR